MKELYRLAPYLKKYKKKLYWGFAFVAVSNVCSTYVPRIIGRAIDRISKGSFSQSEIIWDVALLLLLTAVSGLLMFLTRQTIIVASRLIEYDLRKDFLLSIEKQPLEYFNRNPTGSLMAYATNDISAAREFLGPAVMYSANTITTFAFVIYFMLSIDAVTTLLALLPLPVIAITTYKIGGKVHIAFKSVQQQFSELSAHAQESFSGIRVIRSYNSEHFESGIFQKMSKDYYKKNMKLALYQSSMMPVIAALVGISLLILLGWGGLGVMSGRITIGDLTQFFIYLTMLIWPFAAVGWITNIVQRASASAARLGVVFDSVPDSPEGDSGSEVNIISKGKIEFKNVGIRFGEELPKVLDDLTFEVPAGASIGITGSIGSGKSTIVNLITKLFIPTQGKIFIDGIDIKKIKIDTLRNNIAVVPQDPFLFSMSIAENIKFGKPDASAVEIEEAAEIACLHDEILSFPEKYDTMLGERGITLSGGQKQRAALARAIIRKPAILALDDALSSVDTQTEKNILQNLRRFMADRTTLIISHRLSTIENADNIIYISDGAILESGSHSSLMAAGGKYAELYKRQQLEEELQKSDLIEK